MVLSTIQQTMAVMMHTKPLPKEVDHQAVPACFHDSSTAYTPTPRDRPVAAAVSRRRTPVCTHGAGSGTATAVAVARCQTLPARAWCSALAVEHAQNV